MTSTVLWSASCLSLSMAEYLVRCDDCPEILDDFSLPNIGEQFLKLRAVRVCYDSAVIHIGILQMKVWIL